MRKITVLTLLLALLASCDPRSGSEEFAPPQIVDVSASVVRTRATLSCTITSSRADRCGFLVGLDADNLEEYEAEMRPGIFPASREPKIREALLFSGISASREVSHPFRHHVIVVESLYTTENDNIPENEFWKAIHAKLFHSRTALFLPR